MGKICFVKRDFKPGFTVSGPVNNTQSISKLSFSALNRKQRRYIERKMKEEQNETKNS
jgi:hypothetical protein